MTGRASCEAWLTEGKDHTLESPDPNSQPDAVPTCRWWQDGQVSRQPEKTGSSGGGPGSRRASGKRNKIQDWSVTATLSESVEVEPESEAIRPPPGLEMLSDIEMARLWQQWPCSPSANVGALAGPGESVSPRSHVASTAETGSCRSSQQPEAEVEEHSESQNSDAHSEKHLQDDVPELGDGSSQDQDVTVAGRDLQDPPATEAQKVEEVAKEAFEAKEEAKQVVEEQKKAVGNEEEAVQEEEEEEGEEAVLEEAEEEVVEEAVPEEEEEKKATEEEEKVVEEAEEVVNEAEEVLEEAVEEAVEEAEEVVEEAEEAVQEEEEAVEEQEEEEEEEEAAEEQEEEEDEEAVEEAQEAVEAVEPVQEEEEEEEVVEEEGEEEEAVEEEVEAAEEADDDEERPDEELQEEESTENQEEDHNLANEDEQEECPIGVNSSRDEGFAPRADPKRKKKKATKKGNSGNARGRQAAVPRSRVRPPKNQEFDEELLKDARTGRFYRPATLLLVVLLVPALWILWARGALEKPGGRQSAQSSVPEHCTTEIPSNIQQIALDKFPSEPPAQSVPRVTLYSPCLWVGFEKAAKSWAPSARWSWKQTRPWEVETVELQHPNERPLNILNVSKALPAKKFQGHLFKGLARSIFPMFGELTEENYGFYLQQHSTGLVVLFPDPELHITLVKAQAYWRPIFEGIYSRWVPRYRFVYTSTMDSASRDWIRKEFGVTHFPAVAMRSARWDSYVPVHRREAGYSGPWHVFKTDLTYENLLLHIQDVDAGCHTWHNPTWTFRGVRRDSKHEGICPV